MGTLARQLGAVATGSFQLTFLLGLTLTCAIHLFTISFGVGSILTKLQGCSLARPAELSLLLAEGRLGRPFLDACAQLTAQEVSLAFQVQTENLFLKLTCLQTGRLI